MFGDATSTGAFGAVHLVILGVVFVALAATLGLYLLGLPIGMAGVAFIGIVVGSMLLARPLFDRASPEFDHIDRE